MSSQYINLPVEGGSGSGIESINGDTNPDQQITAGSGISVSTTAGNTVITSTSAGGSVTSVAVATANGFAGTVADPTSTPIITVETSVTGILYGNGTAVAAATSGNFPTLNQNTSGTAANITATSNSSLTTLSALSLPGSQVTGAISGSQVTGDISGNAANITATSNSSLTTLSALSLPYSQVTGGPSTSAITALTGDGTASGPGSAALTLATVLASPGTYPKVTVNGKGLVTAGANLSSGDIPNNAANTSGTAANITASSNSSLTTLSALSLPYSQLTSVPTAPGSVVADAYYPGSASNYWGNNGTGSFQDFGVNGTIPSPTVLFNTTFGTIGLAASSLPGISLTAPRTGIIEFTVIAAVVWTENTAGQGVTPQLSLVETITSTIMGYASLVSVSTLTSNPTQVQMQIIGHFPATASTAYNFKLQGQVNGATMYIGGTTATQTCLNFSLKYIS
jgi:hypothetical protein